MKRYSTSPRALLLPILVVAGCGEAANPFTPATGADAARQYWALTLDHKAITLSTTPPYNELKLTATPRNQLGEALAGAEPATFRSTSPSDVAVAQDGTIRALRPLGFGANVYVIAELKIGGRLRADTAQVMVTADAAPPVLASVTVRPLPPDSTIWPMSGYGAGSQIRGDGTLVPAGFFKLLSARSADVNGAPIPGLVYSVRSSDPAVAAALPFGGSIFLLLPGFPSGKPGRVDLITSATAYGVTKVDTVSFSITMPAYAVVKIARRQAAVGSAPRPAFVSDDIAVTPGGTVIWANVSGEPVDIVFDDPSNVIEHGAMSCAAASVVDPGGVGNVPAFGVPQNPAARLNVENCRSRRFPVPGVYPYRSTLTGATGRVVVATGL